MSKSGGGAAERRVRFLAVLFFLLALIPAPHSIAAQASACRPDVEPNNSEAQAEHVESAFCIAGDLPEAADQDLFLWTVSETDAKSIWTLTVDGPAGVVTGAKIFNLSSAPGVEPVVADQKIAEINKVPESRAPVTGDFLVAPGQYLVGISRTDTTSSTPPITTGYQLSLAKSERLPKRRDKEPNDDATTASKLGADFDTAGDLKDSDDYYAWTLSPEDAGSGWELFAQGALGTSLYLTITSEDGTQVASYSSDSVARIHAYDLALPAGTYYLHLGSSTPLSSPYVMRSARTAKPEFDLEPNDLTETAVPIDLDKPVIKGRLAERNDRDFYQLTVDDNLAGSLFDIRFLSKTTLDRSVCLSDPETRADLQCKRGPGGASLSNMLLPRGVYVISVSGEPDPDQPYILRIDVTTPPSPVYETEPNDLEEFASVLDPTQPIQGRFDGTEWDVFRVTTSGDPQLWDVTITGTGVQELDLSKRDGTNLARAQADVNTPSPALYDLYLTPGDHWIRAYGADGDYTITLTPRGPPPPDGEHETNNDVNYAEPMLLGDSKSGRMVTANDYDVFRFSLAAREHVRIQLDVPDDGIFRAMLDWGRERVYDRTSAQPGDDLAMDLMLEPGDYLLTLSNNQPSAERYSLRVLRDDPFLLSDDQEPNNTIASAQPLLPGKEMSGEIASGDAQDVYLVAPGADRSLSFTFVSDGAYITLSDGSSTYINMTPDGTTWTPDQRLPDDIPLYAVITGTGTYKVTYGKPEGTTGPKLPKLFTAAPKPPVDMSMTLDVDKVAAYWTEGQVVSGTLALTNTSPDQVNFTLQTASSHYHFDVELTDAPASIAAGATLSVPVTLRIDPDAWADIPVRITVALESGGLIGTTYTEITPTAEAEPVNPVQMWPIPDAMLGGLDLASPALGAIVAGTFNPDQEALLHDAVAPIGTGFYASAPVLPLTLTVDLAGDAPAPVAGIILNPQTNYGLPQEQVRDFELRLSTDGVTYTTALSGTLSALNREQAFALPALVDARFAQLVIISTYDPNPTQPNELSLGEWSVIAQPGFVPDTATQINIADWAQGGHVVRADPQLQSPDTGISMLSPDPILNLEYPRDVTSLSWVIGFNDDRIAKIAELGWVDSEGTKAEYQLTSLVVEVSTGSSAGPWHKVGTWKLKRADDGSVRSYKLKKPAWARYVRLSTPITEDLISYEYPGQLMIYESPTGPDYRSVTGAWGGTNRSGIYEYLNPPATEAVSDLNDAPDEQADAAPLKIGETVNGRAHIGTDVDWYKVTAPDDDNTLTFTLTGTPSVDVTVRLYDTSGQEVEAIRTVEGDTSQVTYTATVEPGADYTIEVQQPPHSIVFTFDTSGSMGPYAPLVQQSLRSFAGGVTKGQEFVQVIAFETDPLLDTWTDDSYVVYSAINGYYDQSSSSSAEKGVLDATKLLAGQEGTTAILIITDAETSSFDKTLEMWTAVDAVQPRIFAVHVAGSTTPVLNEHLMEDWSANGGYYQYTLSQAEMDRAFDRAATWLRRPAGYSITVASSFEEIATPTPEPTNTPEPTPTEASTEPGNLSIQPAPESGGETGSAAVSDQVTIEIILDTSGSMLAAMPDGQRRIDVARNVLTDLVTTKLPPGVPVTLRTFGYQPDSCDTQQIVPVQPLDPASMAATIQSIEPVNLVKTPIGASLEQVANDLAGVTGPKIVVLVTDGEETCGGDAAKAIQSLIDQGIDVQVNIVGFALNNDALRAQFRDWAQIGNGSYFDATNAQELDQAIAKAVLAPFRVLDGDGNVVASGTVGGDPIDLPPGTYTVVVLTDPEQRFESVVIEPGGSVELQLTAP